MLEAGSAHTGSSHCAIKGSAALSVVRSSRRHCARHTGTQKGGGVAPCTLKFDT